VISREAIQDLLDADTARRQADRPVLITAIGRDMLMRYLREMDKMKLSQIDKLTVEQSWP
jgi:hypothetical protein